MIALLTQAEIRVEKRDNAALVQIQGTLFAGNTRELAKVFAGLVRQGYHCVIVDLRHATFLDSAALGILRIYHDRLARDEGGLCLVNPAPALRQIIQFAHFLDALPIYETQNEAEQQFGIS